MQEIQVGSLCQEDPGGKCLTRQYSGEIHEQRSLIAAEYGVTAKRVEHHLVTNQ